MLKGSMFIANSCTYIPNLHAAGALAGAAGPGVLHDVRAAPAGQLHLRAAKAGAGHWRDSRRGALPVLPGPGHRRRLLPQVRVHFCRVYFKKFVIKYLFPLYLEAQTRWYHSCEIEKSTDKFWTSQTVMLPCLYTKDPAFDGAQLWLTPAFAMGMPAQPGARAAPSTAAALRSAIASWA